MKLNSEHLFELSTLEINKIWRMQYFFRYCLNTTVYEFNNFNIGTVNAIRKKFVQLHEMGEQIKSSLLLTVVILVSLFLLHLSFACNPTSYFNMGKKLRRHISFSSTCSCHYRKHPKNDNNICPQAFSACSQQHFYD